MTDINCYKCKNLNLNQKMIKMIFDKKKGHIHPFLFAKHIQMIEEKWQNQTKIGSTKQKQKKDKIGKTGKYICTSWKWIPARPTKSFGYTKKMKEKLLIEFFYKCINWY